MNLAKYHIFTTPKFKWVYIKHNFTTHTLAKLVKYKIFTFPYPFGTSPITSILYSGR